MAQNSKPLKFPNACVVCNGREFRRTFEAKNAEVAGDIVYCVSCGLKTVYPLPGLETIAAYYKGMYSNKASQFDPIQMEQSRASIRAYVELLKHHGNFRSGMSFLDVGGGLGYYSQAAQEIGMEATLVDPDAVSIDFAKNNHKLSNSFLGMLPDYSSQSGNTRHDIVMLRHVIEHVPNPRALLDDVKKCLKPGGILLLETDNGRGIEMLLKPGVCKWYLETYRKNYKDVTLGSLIRLRPFAVDPPRHLYAFSVSNLCKLLSEHEFQPRKSFTYRFGDPGFWPNLPDVRLHSVWGAFKQRNFREFAMQAGDWLLAPIRRLSVPLRRSAGICILAART